MMKQRILRLGTTVLCLVLLLLLPLSCWADRMSRSQALRELQLKSKSFTEAELKAAYRKRSLETHPDKGGSNEEFVRVAEAYQVLSSSSSSSSSSSFGGSSSGAGPKYKFSRDPNDGGPGMNQEELLRQAEDMFFEMYEDFFSNNQQGVDALIDQLFEGGAKNKNKEVSSSSWTNRMVQSGVKWVARKVLSGFLRLMESDSATIQMNGQTMSGKEFKEWRAKMQARRDQKPTRQKSIDRDDL